MDEPTVQVPQHKPRKRSGLVFPLIIILLGVAWLLHELGYTFDWDIILPAVVILLGVGLLFERKASTWFAFVLLVIAIIAFFVFSVVQNADDGVINIISPRHLETPRTVEKEVAIDQFSDIARIDMEIEVPAGELTVSSQVIDASKLVTARATFSDENLEPEFTADKSGDTLQVRYDVPSQEWLSFFSREDATYDVRLQQSATPLDLLTRIGSGTANEEFTGVPLEKLKTDIGSGSATLAFAGAVPAAGEMDFLVGSGNLAMRDIHDAGFSSVEGTIGSGELMLEFGTPSDAAKPLDATIRVGSGDVVVTIAEDQNFSIASSVGSGKITVDGEEVSHGYRTASDDGPFITFSFTVGSGDIAITRK